MSRILDFRGGDTYEEYDLGGLDFDLDAANYTTDDVTGTSSTELSDEQEITLIVLQFCSGLLSLIGSSAIVFKIIRSLHQTKSSMPYDRIILGLSSCDIFSSLTYAVGPFLLPSQTSRRIWAIGNESTCTYLGFMSQLACLWAIWYNCILSYYYLLTVRFKVKRKEFCRKYELWLHLTGVIFFPLTAVIGLFGDWYSEMRFNMICWIGEVPKGCYESGNCFGLIIAYVYGGIPTVITVFSVIINNIIICIFIQRSLLSTPPAAWSSGSESMDMENSRSENSKSERESEDLPQGLSVKQKLAKEAATQCFLYVTTFLLTFSPSFVIQVLEGSVALGEEDLVGLYPLLVLNAMLLPLQGFFNVFIYVRPTYNRFFDAYPEKSKWIILKQALFDPNIPRMSTVSTVAAPAAEKKHSGMSRRISGSNFSMSLDKIMEEDGSSDSASLEDGDVSITVENSTEFQSTGFQKVVGERRDSK